jgi:arginine/lysine/histidine transporter system substrate-binding protein
MYMKIFKGIIKELLCSIAAFFIFFLIIQTVLLVKRVQKKPQAYTEITTLIVGTSSDYPPFTFIKDGELMGFEIDLVEEIGGRLSTTIEFKDMAFANLIPGLMTGKIHLIAAGLTPTEERAKRVLFSTPYITDESLVIITTATHKVTSINDLRGKEVVVNEGYSADQYMTQWAGSNLIRLTCPADAFLALKSNRAFAYVDAKIAVGPFFQCYNNDQFTMTPIEGTAQSIALAVSPSHSLLLAKIENVLDALQTDGTLEALKKKWGIA